MSKPLEQFYQFGSFGLDAANRLLFHNQELVPLTAKSIEILLVLVESEGGVVGKDDLMSRVWPDSFVEEANLAHHVYLLRKVLGEGSNGTQFIQTIPRRGYRFVADVRKTVNGGETDRSKTSEAKPSSPKDLNQRLPAHDSGSPHSPVDIFPIPKLFNGDADNSVETSSGGAQRPASVSTSRTSTSVDQRAQLGSTRPSPGTESWIRAGMPLRAVSGRLWASALIAVALLVGIVWFKSAHEKAEGEQGSQARISPFTTLAGMENQPTFSPDGNQVAFCWNGENQDNVDIYVKLIGTESLLRLTTNPAQDTSPAWSPDGRFIAFLRNTREESGFYVVPALGPPERKIAAAFPARAHYRGRSLDWTPDGKYLVVVDRESEETPFNISGVFSKVSG